MSKGTGSEYLVDGAFDWTDGVDSSKVTTIQSDLNPNGLKRTQLAWLNNATVRGGGITQRTGWQPLQKIVDSGRWQGGYMYEPDSANPYLVCLISGITYAVLLEPPYTVTDLTNGDPLLINPEDPVMAWFVQGENILVIQAGDYYNPGPFIAGVTDTNNRTLPLFWNGTTLRRSKGITTTSPPSMAPNINEIPAATCMDYYGGHIWYAQGRQYSAGDMVGGPSGNPVNHLRDSIISVTENPLCFGGDGFTVPTNAGNIRALKHSANINKSLGEDTFYIFTRKAVYSLDVPVTRGDWINATANLQPRQTVAQLTNGSTGDRCVVPINGDLYYQAFDPSIRSLVTAQRAFSSPGNVPISQNEQRALDLNNRALMFASSGVEFNNRLLNLVLPTVAADGINIVHKAILPLDFDVVSNLTEAKPAVWEGCHDGLDFLQIFSGDFGGLPRAFGAIVSEEDGSLKVWELTTYDRRQNGDARVTWSFETPSFTWSAAGMEHELKQLNGGEIWVDKIAGVVDMDFYYRADADPCWRRWFHTQVCSNRCEDLADAVLTAYPCEPEREGYVFPVVLPEPPAACNSMGTRPSTVGYQHQLKVVIKGWCRVRGILLHCQPRERSQYQGINCGTQQNYGMRSLHDPFAPPA